MEIKDTIFKEFIKNGYATERGKKVWDIAQRNLLYLSEDQAKEFLKLRTLPVYRKQIMDREIALLRAHAPKLLKAVGSEPFNLIDVFCGDGKKAVTFLDAVAPTGPIRYFPANVNSYLTNMATQNVKQAHSGLVSELKPSVVECHGEALSRLIGSIRNSAYPKNVVLLFGSVLASYEINDYLFHLSQGMFQGDVLIIGNGVRKGERLADLSKYKESVWNDWFMHVMRGIGFKEDEVTYDARFGNSRVEMFYTVKTEKKLKYMGKEVNFSPGDEVLVAILYKYFPTELERFCKMYFPQVKLVVDKDKEYGLIVCSK